MLRIKLEGIDLLNLTEIKNVKFLKLYNGFIFGTFEIQVFK